MITRNPILAARQSLLAAAIGSLFIVSCASPPVKPAGAAQAREKLTRLQADPQLATRAPLAIQDAESAVRNAEQPQSDTDVGDHRVYIADRKIDIARAQAEARLAEDQRPGLKAQRESARLDARTREADRADIELNAARADNADQRIATALARNDADAARADSAGQRLATDQARNDADAARADSTEQRLAAEQVRTDANAAQAESASQLMAARADTANQRLAADAARNDATTAREASASSEQQAAELRQQIATLQARPTDRGLVLTLGDVQFASGRSDLKSSATGKLNRVVAFLNRYPDRTALIEGYTDSQGGGDYNQMLSLRRADSVKSYLTGQGIGMVRISASGKGDADPVAGNDTASGRQQNRRVEVIISNPVIE